MEPTTAEECRAQAQAFLQKVIEAGPVVHAYLGADGLKMIQAARDLFAADDPIVTERFWERWKALP